MLTNKTVLLGVTGGIAAYKAAALASMLVKLHANVEVVMTESILRERSKEFARKTVFLCDRRHAKNFPL